jgi:DNA-binding transcriptional regulator YdaS (Cro superfamily)
LLLQLQIANAIVRRMNLSEYLEKDTTTAAALARQLGVSPGMVYQWKVGIRQVPITRCEQIETLTVGKVSREELRPDVWGSLKRETSGANT